MHVDVVVSDVELQLVENRIQSEVRLFRLNHSHELINVESLQEQFKTLFVAIVEEVLDEHLQFLVVDLAPYLIGQSVIFSSINFQKHQQLFKKWSNIDQRNYFLYPALKFIILQFAKNVDQVHQVLKACLLAKLNQVLFSYEIHFFKI